MRQSSSRDRHERRPGIAYKCERERFIAVQRDRRRQRNMFYKGGTLRFGKLMMLDAEMQIVDLRPSGFFGFSLDRYQEQLVAGYERTLPDMGLLVYMLGVEKLGSASGAPASPP